MLMILARLVRSESFWAVVKVRSPHNGRKYRTLDGGGRGQGIRTEARNAMASPPLAGCSLSLYTPPPVNKK